MTELEKYDLEDFLREKLSIFAEVESGVIRIKLFLDNDVISVARIGVGDSVDVWQAY